MSTNIRRVVFSGCASLFALGLLACASGGGGQPDPYYRSADPYYNDPYYADPYYRQPGYIVVDPAGERLEREQRRETKDLNQDQHDDKRDLKREQEAERKALRQAGEWDASDRKAQKQERKAQKREFEREDRELREQQREEWRDRY
jgi:hypothetical protein